MDYLRRSWKKPPWALLVGALGIALLAILFVGGKVNSQEATPSGAVGNPPAAAPKAVLKCYSCPAGAAEAMANRLEQQYPPSTGVRVVADPRTSQVLVIAVPEVQDQIGKQWRQGSSGAASAEKQPQPAPQSQPAPSTPAGPGASSSSTRQDLQLWNVSGRDLEVALLRSLGDRLSPTAGPGAAPAYRLTLPGGQALLIGIDRQKNLATVEGTGAAVASATQLIHVLDHPQNAGQNDVGFCMLNKARKTDVATVAAAFQDSSAAPAASAPAASSTAGQQTQPAAPSAAAPETGHEPTSEMVPAVPGPLGEASADGQEGLIGPVQIQILDGLDVLVVRGHQRDVQRVMELIQQIERLSTETKPTIQILPLAHVDSVALAGVLRDVYAEAFAARLGSLSITALGKPNAVLLIGRPETVETAVDLVRRLDQPVPPDTQFRIFHFKNIPAESAKENIDALFGQQQAQATTAQQPRPQTGSQQQAATETGRLAPRVQIVVDFRSNSIIVRGNPRELNEVAALVSRMDGGVNAAVNQVRVFRLKNSMAENLALVIQDAITGQIYGQKSNRNQLAMSMMGGAMGRNRQDWEQKSARLQFATVGPNGQQVLSSGILTDAQVTADTRTNALVVTASGESMPLIAALIEELDQPSEAEALVKVFTLINGDASSMVQMLTQIFGQTGQANTAEAMAVRTGISVDQSTLVGLKFGLDVRTNSVVVTGSAGALTVVEAILVRLDSTDVWQRRTSVYRLKNVGALDAAQAINEYLKNEKTAYTTEEGFLSPNELFEREVVVVAEPVSNSLIISATPRFYEQVMKIVNDIDMRPPMVMIQVLIAEVALDNKDEFGVELGLQDKVLFDRSSAITGASSGSTLFPGFQFNSQHLGNSNTDKSLATAHTVGGQSLTNLGVGRTNSDLGFGGLVLSASSDSVSLLIRALQQQHRLQILSRPQVMTMDNTQAQILVGQEVPTITDTQLSQYGSVNTVEYKEVGLIVTVTPRVSPDRLVVMEIEAIKSKLEPLSQGIPISITPTGEPIRSPIIDATTTRNVVSALDGQTIVLGGMISKTTDHLQNKVPYLSEIPVLGQLFQFKSDTEERTELLIIMTPRIVGTAQDAETIKRVEAARMHWCLCDVMALQDGDGLGKNGPSWYDGDAAVIYPDLDPTLKTMQELVPPGETQAPVGGQETVAPPAGNPPAGNPPVPATPGRMPPPGPTITPPPPKAGNVPSAPPGNGAATRPNNQTDAETQVRILSQSQAAVSPTGSPVPQTSWTQLQPSSDGQQPTYVRYYAPNYGTAASPAANR